MSLGRKSHSCRIRIIKGDFLFYIKNGILCMLIRIASIRPTQHTFILKKIEKISLVCLLTRRFEQPMTQEYSSYFTDAGIKNDRAIKGHNLKKL